MAGPDLLISWRRIYQTTEKRGFPELRLPTSPTGSVISPKYDGLRRTSRRCDRPIVRLPTKSDRSLRNKTIGHPKTIGHSSRDSVKMPQSLARAFLLFPPIPDTNLGCTGSTVIQTSGTNCVRPLSLAQGNGSDFGFLPWSVPDSLPRLWECQPHR
jgi:hypothetical protein